MHDANEQLPGYGYLGMGESGHAGLGAQGLPPPRETSAYPEGVAPMPEEQPGGVRLRGSSAARLGPFGSSPSSPSSAVAPASGARMDSPTKLVDGMQLVIEKHNVRKVGLQVDENRASPSPNPQSSPDVVSVRTAATAHSAVAARTYFSLSPKPKVSSSPSRSAPAWRSPHPSSFSVPLTAWSAPQVLRPTGLFKWLAAFCVLECVGAATLPTSPAPELDLFDMIGTQFCPEPSAQAIACAASCTTRPQASLAEPAAVACCPLAGGASTTVAAGRRWMPAVGLHGGGSPAPAATASASGRQLKPPSAPRSPPPPELRDTLALQGAESLQGQGHQPAFSSDTAFQSDLESAPRSPPPPELRNTLALQGADSGYNSAFMSDSRRARVQLGGWLGSKWRQWQKRDREGKLDPDNPGKMFGTKRVAIVLTSYDPNALDRYGPWNYGPIKNLFGGSPEKFAEAVVLHSTRAAPIYIATHLYIASSA